MSLIGFVYTIEQSRIQVVEKTVERFDTSTTLGHRGTTPQASRLETTRK